MKRILSAASVCFCLAQMSRAENIRFISHRGESYDAPENTMAAFQLAVDRQTAGFECDVYLTADNEIVCIHDATTTRTTDGSLTVAASTLAQLKALDAGSWKGAQFAGERIPTLSEALALARDGMEIYVEIKCGTEILPRLIQVMAAEPKATPARVVFISFSSAVISAVRQQFPAYRAYWLTSVSDSGGAPSPSAASAIATMQANGATGLDAYAHALVDAAYVQAVKNAGYSFHVWTVNDIARAAALSAIGVETITTDRGGYLATALNEPAPAPVPVVHWTFDGGSATNLGS
ncbi:MAG: glycerophosphodiester phosphodiesterase, partial [Kiritimatiellae bacterium]|nr:glycerophosphodiester phosphodiesterase [Kiritimatiellia bacterium]